MNKDKWEILPLVKGEASNNDKFKIVDEKKRVRFTGSLASCMSMKDLL